MVGQASVISLASCSFTGRSVRKAAILASVSVALALTASSAARAQCNLPAIVPSVFNAAGALPASIATSVATVSTVFLTQTTAFVASPAATQPDQFAGGLWIRGAGGRADVDTSAVGNFAIVPAPPPVPPAGNFLCNFSTRSDYAGVQGGFDIGRLDWGGVNVHFGVTAGYLGTSNTTGAAKVDFDVPFVGLYAALVSGGFYLDAQVRYDMYNMSLSDPSVSVSGQRLNARGWGITSSAGYVFNLGNFIVEPSVGVVYSNVSVDPLNFAFAAPPLGVVSGTLNIADIESVLGRAGVRIATNFTLGDFAVQPFVAASVWHEFGADLSGSAAARCPAPCGVIPVALDISGTAIGDRVGTFGQYSLGFAASLPDTPWLGYFRFDYRNGDRFESINFSGGIRYQFAPEAAPPVVKARS
jgi:hypothetical protein